MFLADATSSLMIIISGKRALKRDGSVGVYSVDWRLDDSGNLIATFKYSSDILGKGNRLPLGMSRGRAGTNWQIWQGGRLWFPEGWRS